VVDSTVASGVGTTVTVDLAVTQAPPEARSARIRLMLRPFGAGAAALLVDNVYFYAATPPPAPAPSSTATPTPGQPGAPPPSSPGSPDPPPGLGAAQPPPPDAPPGVQAPAPGPELPSEQQGSPRS